MADFSNFFPSADAPITSVFGRQGVVVALVGDYAAFYAPLVHTHIVSDITDFPTTMPPSAHTHLWVDITDKPTTFPPSAHTHLEVEITDLDKYTQAEVDAMQLLKEDAISYGTPEYMAVANATSDGFNFVPQPDFEFYRLRGTVLPYTGATPNGFADTSGDNVVPELVADVAPAGVGDPSGVTYRCAIDLGSVVISIGDAAINITAGDLLFWSGDSSKWLHLPQEVAVSVTSVNTKVGDVVISGSANITVGDGGGSIITLALTGVSLVGHTHVVADITDFPTTMPPSAHTHLWADITDKPATFPPSAHTHLEAEITDLDKYTQAEVDALIAAVPTGITYELLATSVALEDNKGYLCDSTAGALSLILPAGVDNSKVEVIDRVGLAGTNNITILPNGADTIMGGVDFILTANFTGVEFVKIGTDWLFIGSLGESVQAV